MKFRDLRNKFYIQEKVKYNILDYTTIFFLLFSSGFLFFNIIEYGLQLTFFITLVIYLYKKNALPSSKFLLFIFIFFSLVVIHAIEFDYLRIVAILGLIFRILIAYFSVKILGRKFFKIFVSFVSFISVISIILFILSQIFPALVHIGVIVPERKWEDESNIIIYNFSSSFRNYGPYWEPGAFGGFLCIALFFNLFLNNENILSKKSAVIIFTIISTFSTTAYIVLLMIIFLHFFYQSRKNFIFLIFFIILVFPTIYIVSKFDFMQKKIYTQIEYVNDYHLGYETKSSTGRFFSTYLDFQDFWKNPLFGVGVTNKTRFEMLGYDEDPSGKLYYISTNGWSDFLVKFGLIGFLFYFIGFYKSATIYLNKSSSQNNAIWFMVVIFTIGFSETYFYFPYFWALSLFYTTTHKF